MKKNKVFIGAGEASAVEARVLIYSLRKNSKLNDFDIFVFNGTHDCLEDESGNVIKRINMPLEAKYSGVTEFSNYRWLIPELCDFEGKALWLDSDTICLSDISELFTIDMVSHAILAKKDAYSDRGEECWGLSVCVIDCQKFSVDLVKVFRSIQERKFSYGDLQMFTKKFLSHFNVDIGVLEDNWNSFDYYDSSTKLIHYTDLWSQPWKYYNHPYGKLWFTYLHEALRNGFIDRSKIDLAVARAYVRKDLLGGNSRTSVVSYKLKSRIKALVKRAEYFFFNDLSIYLTPIMSTRNRLKFYFRHSFQSSSTDQRKSIFYISSKAEERIFQSLLAQLPSGQMLDRIVLIDSFGTTSSDFPSVESYSSFAEYILKNDPGKVGSFFSCLDFEKFPSNHSLGIAAVKFMNFLNVKTICIQHGGRRNDNLQGMTTSCSSILMVWDEETRDILQKEYDSTKEIRVLGNPIWIQKLKNHRPTESFFETQNRKILLATCLHTEYDHLSNPAHLYQNYIEALAEAFQGFEGIEIIVKPHPVDSQKEIEMYRKHFQRIELNGPIYDLLKDCEIILSRASTVMEEGLMLGKIAIGFDPVEDGPLLMYSRLKSFPNFYVAQSSKDLRKILETLMTSEQRGRQLDPQIQNINWNVLDDLIKL